MPSAKHLVILLAVPMLAAAVFGRQVYLQIFHDLSVWKGGGMGMFASIDAPRQRFLKIYIRDPLGQRILVDRFNSRQQRLIAAARIVPRSENFAALTQNLLSSRWVLRREMVEVYQVDPTGSRLGGPPDLRLSVAPATAPRQSSLGNAWYPTQVWVEFWKIGYDANTSQLFANRVSAFEVRQRGSGG